MLATILFVNEALLILGVEASTGLNSNCLLEVFFIHQDTVQCHLATVFISRSELAVLDDFIAKYCVRV